MQMMHWYNPTTRTEEDVPAPLSDAQAIEMLSGHPNSEQFIEEYRRRRVSPRVSQSGLVEALIQTGETFYWEHRKGQPPG
jgi:hypothetical protein